VRRSNEPAAAGKDPPLVLLVEDNDINALLARRMLEKAGCEVRCAAMAARRSMPCASGRQPSRPSTGVHGRAHAGPRRPGGDARHQGLYAAQPSPGLRPPPIVALTANAFEEDRRRCMEAGMDDLPAKPFDRDDLQQVLDKWCGARAATHAA
jgi:CheY-like chemotaxis protein